MTSHEALLHAIYDLTFLWSHRLCCLISMNQLISQRKVICSCVPNCHFGNHSSSVFVKDEFCWIGVFIVLTFG